MNRFATRVSTVLLFGAFLLLPHFSHAISLASFTIDQGSIVGGSAQVATGTVTINRGPNENQSVGYNVNAQSSGCVTIGSSQNVIPAGANSGTFTVWGCGPVSGNQAVTVTVLLQADPSQTLSASFSIVPFTVNLNLSNTTLVGGSTQTASATVTVSPAVKASTTVNLSSGAALSLNPGSVTIPAGGSTVSFSVSAGNVTATETDPVTATVGVPATQNVTVNPLQVIAVNAPPILYMHSNAAAFATVYLNAPVSSRYLSASTTTGNVYIPNTPLVWQSSSGTFQINPSSVGLDTIKVTLNGTVTAPVQVVDSDQPHTKGCQDDICGEPINMTNGNTWIEHKDYFAPGLGGLSLTRTWNSLWDNLAPPQTVGMFGDSWTSTYEERIQNISGGNTRYWKGDGSSWTFSFDSAHNIYYIVAPQDAHGTMSYSSISGQTTIGYPTGESRVFNSSGRLTALIDRNGNQTTVTRDAYGRISLVTDSAGRTLSFNYPNNSATLVSSVNDSTGTVATYTYSGSYLTKVVYADGGTLNFSFDGNHLITSVTDADSKVLESHTYDGGRRGLTSVRANGVDSVTVSYTNSGSSHLVDSLGNASDYGYATIGGAGYVNAISGSGCASCGNSQPGSFSYDSQGNKLSATDSNNVITRYTYDSQGNPTSITRPLDGSHNQIWSYTYNSFNEVLTTTDPLGNVTTNTYDANGNLLTTTTPSPYGTTAASTTTFTYDAKGELLTIADPLNHTTTLTYTTAGLVRTITDAQNNVTTYGYDARGNRTSVTDAAQNQTTYTYDSRNRLTKITYPDQTTTQFAYDTRGRRTSVTDQNNKVTTYAYDDADRLISVTDAQQPTAGVTQYAYDTENNLTSITDALNRQTSFTYDKNRRVKKTTFPSTLAESYTYDANNNLLTKTDRNGNTITYSYDNLNRMSTKQYPNSGGTVNYTYDLANRMTQVSDATGTYGFSYDNMGRLTGTTTQYSFLAGNTYTNSYSYDAASNRTGFTAPDGSTNTYAYDSLNRLSTLTNSLTGQFGFGYDTLNRRTSLTRPNGVNTSYGYDSLSHLLSILHQASGVTIDGATYTYDNAGNRLSKLNELNGISENYSYDNIYQLTQVQQILNGSPTTTESYSYDMVGNRLSSLNVASYSYNSSNELTTSADGYTYTYDNNGNMLTKVTSGNTTSYIWDYENRLTQVTLPGTAGSVTFQYDPLGRRVQKISTTGTTNYLYDLLGSVEELDSGGSVRTRYTQGNGMDEPMAENQIGGSSYYGIDGLGSVTTLTNSGGSITESYAYNAFGGVSASSGTLANPFQYTARDFDSETSLLDLRARYFDSTVGRFLNEDPIGFLGGGNFYRYVRNNPVRYKDPTGKADPAAAVAIGGAAVGTAGAADGAAAAAAVAGAAAGAAVVGAGAAGWVAGRLIGHIPTGNGQTVDDAVTNAFTNGLLWFQNSHQTNNACKKDDDICYQLYLAETAECGSKYTDDREYDRCMEVAWLNYQRCKDNLPPIK